MLGEAPYFALCRPPNNEEKLVLSPLLWHAGSQRLLAGRLAVFQGRRLGGLIFGEARQLALLEDNESLLSHQNKLP